MVSKLLGMVVSSLYIAYTLFSAYPLLRSVVWSKYSSCSPYTWSLLLGPCLVLHTHTNVYFHGESLGLYEYSHSFKFLTFALACWRSDCSPQGKLQLHNQGKRAQDAGASGIHIINFKIGTSFFCHLFPSWKFIFEAAGAS